ncbi:MAG: cell wall hydrolase [Clostridiales bacterium]|nr:cell wall hydrolase [Clostridiales bacterium]
MSSIIAFSPLPLAFASECQAPQPRIMIDRVVLNSPVKPIVINKQASLPVRYISECLGGIVYWNPDEKTASVSYQGVETQVKGAIINDAMMASLDFFSDVFGAEGKFFPKENLVVISTRDSLPSEKEALELIPSYSGYTQEDLLWLAKIVEAEAQGEPYASKLGVASVIINRKESNLYPDTIKDVIFDKRFGVQFTPTANGAVYNSPSAQSWMAAIEALEGTNNAPSTLFFLNPRYATSNWVQKNRRYAFTIGGHNYYY